MTSLEQRAAELRKEKYGTDKLDYELVHNPKDALPTSIDNGPTKPCVHEVNRLDYLKEKFGIKGNSLECEGLLGARLEQSQQSLADASIDRAREDMRGKRLKIANANYQGKPVRLYLEITKT